MIPSTVVILSSALSFGAPLALAVYEIIATRRAPPGRDDDPRPPQAPPPKPLPDCLQPATLLRRDRIRELHDA
jgi:hypothetical protein